MLDLAVVDELTPLAFAGAVLECARVVDDAFIYRFSEPADDVSLESARVCRSLPLGLGEDEEIAGAVAMVRLLHTLAERGVVPDEAVLDCADHELALWVYGEPRLRERVVRRVLGGLEAESPYRRRTLGTTLLAWLEGKRTANALARDLGVHPQTVRYRMRQVRAIFGDALDDRDRCFEIHLALRTQLPSWMPHGTGSVGVVGEEIQGRDAEAIGEVLDRLE